MRPLRILACVATLLLTSACGKSAWTLQAVDPVSGQSFTLHPADLAGKRLYLNYWAGWCKPCLQEIPELNRFASSHGASVILMAVNYDELKEAALLEAAKQAGITYPLLVTRPINLFTLPDIGGLPTTLVLDEQGQVLKVLAGPQTEASLSAALSP